MAFAPLLSDGLDTIFASFPEAVRSMTVVEPSVHSGRGPASEGTRTTFSGLVSRPRADELEVRGLSGGETLRVKVRRRGLDAAFDSGSPVEIEDGDEAGAWRIAAVEADALGTSYTLFMTRVV